MSSADLKGKGKAADLSEVSHASEGGLTDSIYDSDALSEAKDSEEFTPEYLETLVAKAKAGLASRRQQKERCEHVEEEDMITLESEPQDKPLPSLDPGPSLPRPYFQLSSAKTDASFLINDNEVDGIQRSAPSVPALPPPPPELNRDNRPLTKKQKKEQKRATAGPDWFELPAPEAADLPKLYREVEAIRLRNALDPKRFYRKEEGEGKGIKGLPKYFAIGTVLPTTTPFGTASGDNLPKSQRKRTVVDELIDDAEAKHYAKKKFLELQGVRGEKGRGTWARKKAARRGAW